MRLTKGQQSLLKAVRAGNVFQVSELLENTPPDFFPGVPATTPLLEAVKKEDMLIVKILVGYGADVNGVAKAGKTPLDIAQDQGAWDIVVYLENQGAKFGHEIPGRLPRKAPSKKKPVKKNTATGKFNRASKSSSVQAPSPAKGPKAETLTEIFEAEKWVGKVEEMQRRWKEVPKRLQADFDFAAALAEARLKTLKSSVPRKSILKKPAPPTAPPAPPAA